tara:strand:- start:2509 stop:4449 length:1941 start_codon:yes stop_codon:yes gene_type:complete
MDLRIRVGNCNKPEYLTSKNKLKVFYDSNNCIIESDTDLLQYSFGINKKLFFFGKIIGVKINDTKLIGVSNKLNEQIIKIFSSNDLEHAIKKIEGRFIYIFIDGSRIHVGTDSLGQIDLYYQKNKDDTILSSHLGLLPFVKDSNIEYDQVGAAHALYIYGFRPAKKQTLYKKVKRLGVQERIDFKDGKFNLLKIQEEMHNTGDFEHSERHDTYANLFLDAIEKRSSPKGNIVYLSSGWDSTSILAALVHMYGSKKTRAVIGRMNFSKQAGVCNPYEIVRAQKIADYFGVKLEIVEFDYYKRGPELTEKYSSFMRNQMVTSMAMYQWLDLASYVADTSSGEPVFCGEISDGVHNFGFSQSLTVLDHPSHEFREYSDKMASYLYGPTFLNTILNGSFVNDSIYNFLKDRYKGGIFDSPSLHDLEKIKQLFSSMFLRDKRIPFWSLKNSSYFTTKGREFYQHEMEKSYLDEISAKITDKNLYSALINLYSSFHWNGGTVSTLQMTGDLFGLDVNLPFKDSRLIKFLSEMPESWGRGLEMRPTKYPLKNFLKNKIDYPYHLMNGPHSYLYDTDHEFDHAAEWNYRSSFNGQYRNILSKRDYRNVLSEEFFNISYLDKIATNYINGKEVAKEKNDLKNLIYFSIMGFYGQA